MTSQNKCRLKVSLNKLVLATKVLQRNGPLCAHISHGNRCSGALFHCLSSCYMSTHGVKNTAKDPFFFFLKEDTFKSYLSSRKHLLWLLHQHDQRKLTPNVSSSGWPASGSGGTEGSATQRRSTDVCVQQSEEMFMSCSFAATRIHS